MKVKRLGLASQGLGLARPEKFSSLLFLFLLSVFATTELSAQPTAFTYQGSLEDSGAPADASYDFQFALFDQLAAGTQVGTTLTRTNVAVAEGIFTVELDFGSQFPGADRFLEIRVRPAGGGAYTTLAPRQQIASVPYAINATSLGGTAANQYVLTTDPRLSNARAPLPGSPNYIQNTNSLQAASNFNIAGRGRADNFYAENGFFMSGGRILHHAAPSNIYGGYSAGESVTSGSRLAFFGHFAGGDTTTGSENSFFGAFAGGLNTTGSFNSFFGSEAGKQNGSVSGNSYFGARAGEFNVIGSNNSAFGYAAGRQNTSSSNSYFGYEAGEANAAGFGNSAFGAGAMAIASSGDDNAVFGRNAGGNSNGADYNSYFGTRSGLFTTNGSSNSAIGFEAGRLNVTGSNNTLLGARADVGEMDLDFATAIGAGSVVPTSNTIALGRADRSDRVLVPGSLIAGSELGIGPEFEASDSLTAMLSLRGPNDPATGPEIHLSGSLADQFHSGRIRFREGTALTNHRGAFIHFDGLNNLLHLGVHNTSNDDLADDINVITIRRNSNNVGIGREPAANRLEVDGDASKSAAGSWLANSDGRIKTAVEPVSGALDKVLALNPVSFQYTDNYRSAHPGVGDQRYYNVIAQEFAEVFPEAVKGSGEYLAGFEGCADDSTAAGCADHEILQVDTYPALIAALAAIRELAEQNGRLQNEVAALQSTAEQLPELTGRLAVLESLLSARGLPTGGGQP